MRSVAGLRCILTVALVLAASPFARAADGDAWSVGKSSGEVWVSTTGAQPASLKPDENLKPGDTIRTGRNGRVLLVRGQETILIAPNSVISVPPEKKDGMQTTILQQAGSIVLEVEKQNVQHFEVETPYLAAVVKGTLFSVTVNTESTSVEVRRGQVEVSDFKTGQIAQVMPGQIATSFEHGKAGLSLSGQGQLNPIEQGKPRASSIDRVTVPKGGLPAPRNGPSGTVIHALAPSGQSVASASGAPSSQPIKRNVIRISSALGEVSLNVSKATHGLARGPATPGATRNASNKDSTVWSNGGTGGSTASAVGSASNSNSSSSSAAAAASSSPAAAASSSASSTATSVVNTVTAAVSNATGNGATGNGNGNNGNNGNGNGNGNGGVGNGNGKGNAKH
jgi:FecR protein